jgi:hypothetical protein
MFLFSPQQVSVLAPDEATASAAPALQKSGNQVTLVITKSPRNPLWPIFPRSQVAEVGA